MADQLINSLAGKLKTGINLLTKRRNEKCRINSSTEKMNHIVQTQNRTRIVLHAMTSAAGKMEKTNGIKHSSSLWCDGI